VLRELCGRDRRRPGATAVRHRGGRSRAPPGGSAAGPARPL